MLYLQLVSPCMSDFYIYFILVFELFIIIEIIDHM